MVAVFGTGKRKPEIIIMLRLAGICQIGKCRMLQHLDLVTAKIGETLQRVVGDVMSKVEGKRGKNNKVLGARPFRSSTIYQFVACIRAVTVMLEV